MVVIAYVLVNVLIEHSHDFESDMFLQNCVGMHGSCTEACVMLSGNGNQFIFVNIDEVIGPKLEEDPDPTTSPHIKTEPQVSCLCLSVCIYCYSHCISRCLSVFLTYFMGQSPS
jgi:hypothetical protein